MSFSQVCQIVDRIRKLESLRLNRIVESARNRVLAPCLKNGGATRERMRRKLLEAIGNAMQCCGKSPVEVLEIRQRFDRLVEAVDHLLGWEQRCREKLTQRFLPWEEVRVNIYDGEDAIALFQASTDAITPHIEPLRDIAVCLEQQPTRIGAPAQTSYPEDLLDADERTEQLEAEASLQCRFSQIPRRQFDAALDALQLIMWNVVDYYDYPPDAKPRKPESFSQEIVAALLKVCEKLSAIDGTQDPRGMEGSARDSIFEMLQSSISEDRDRARYGFDRAIPLLNLAMDGNPVAIEPTIRKALTHKRLWSAFPWILPIIRVLAGQQQPPTISSPSTVTKNQRMPTLDEVDRRARQIDEQDPTFRFKTAPEWSAILAERFGSKEGCSVGRINKLPFWREVMEETDRGRRSVDTRKRGRGSAEHIGHERDGAIELVNEENTAAFEQALRETVKVAKASRPTVSRFLDAMREATPKDKMDWASQPVQERARILCQYRKGEDDGSGNRVAYSRSRRRE